ncbi:hypothetical protein P0Y31_04060 [Knoellia sp. 3-2P3]|uniref:hypothetical protein n=1 Tax=unclassified Knoellia TaxID=2618719 RepID=UPI0023DC488C|nr:hypothetical protein [Knoellia sp. 3-2P3]MDF2091510.1 hypothetical protein [Knoellia sp. 3-2P3]
MSRTLTEAFDELAEEVQPTDVGRDLAGVAWRQGRRRRLRSRAGRTAAVAAAAAAAAAVVAVVVLGAPSALQQPVPPAGDGATVGHPQRIGRPLVPQLVRQLPERGSALAGVAFAAHELGVGLRGAWYAVGQEGELWDLPIQRFFLAATVPAISPDGRRIAYSDEPSGRYVIRDVVTGQLTRFPTVGAMQLSGADEAGEPAAPPYRTAFQTPAYFSPDGTRVAVRAYAGKAAAPLLLVLGDDGSLREVPLAEELTLAGWLDDDEILVLRPLGLAVSGGAEALVPERLTLDGRRTPLARLSGEGAAVAAASLDQWSPSLSPDRRALLLAVDPTGADAVGPEGPGRRIITFDLASGAQQTNTWTPADQADKPYAVGTPVEWQDGTWVLPRLEAEGLRLGPEGVADPSRALVVTDPRLHLTRLDLADDALSGPTHTSIWGTSVSTLSWRWPEAGLVAGGVGLVVLLWLRRRHRVRSRTQAG